MSRRRATNEHHLCLAFRPDGTVDFVPQTADPAQLARRLRRLIAILVEHPSHIDCAAGHHQGYEEHAGE